MASRRHTRAPQTAHLRSRLRHGISKNTPKLPPRRTEDNSEFRDSIDYYWVTFLNTETSADATKESFVVNFEEISAFSTTTSSSHGEEDTERFCRILKQISDDFAEKGRPYVSMTANAAISLVRKGRQDDINPGLWRYIRQHEESETNKHPKN